MKNILKRLSIVLISLSGLSSYAQMQDSSICIIKKNKDKDSVITCNVNLNHIAKAKFKNNNDYHGQIYRTKLTNSDSDLIYVYSKISEYSYLSLTLKLDSVHDNTVCNLNSNSLIQFVHLMDNKAHSFNFNNQDTNYVFTIDSAIISLLLNKSDNANYVINGSVIIKSKIESENIEIKFKNYQYKRYTLEEIEKLEEVKWKNEVKLFGKCVHFADSIAQFKYFNEFGQYFYFNNNRIKIKYPYLSAIKTIPAYGMCFVFEQSKLGTAYDIYQGSQGGFPYHYKAEDGEKTIFEFNLIPEIYFRNDYNFKSICLQIEVDSIELNKKLDISLIPLKLILKTASSGYIPDDKDSDFVPNVKTGYIMIKNASEKYFQGSISINLKNDKNISINLKGDFLLPVANREKLYRISDENRIYIDRCVNIE